MSQLLAEHQVVVLTEDIPSEGLRAGDVGVVLVGHAGHDRVPPGYTIEITTVTGETVAVVDVPVSAVRPAADCDVRHARSLSRSV